MATAISPGGIELHVTNSKDGTGGASFETSAMSFLTIVGIFPEAAVLLWPGHIVPESLYPLPGIRVRPMMPRGHIPVLN